MNISIASIAIYVAIILAAVIVYTYLREGDRQGAVMFGAIFTVVLALVAMSLATKHQDALLGPSDPTPVSEVATIGGEPLENSGAAEALPFDPPEDLTVKDPSEGTDVGETIADTSDGPGPDTNSGVGTIIRIRPAPSGGEPNPAEPDPD